tara:strand:- start:12125 stop:12517 length:393 start_codon:yes stop_codon:yes gene_type:complete
MRISKQQLRRIIKEERMRILYEEVEEMEIKVDTNEHHWPRVEWSNIGELTDKWADQERNAWDKGDTSMLPEKPEDVSISAWEAEHKAAWEDQVENAALDLEAELTTRIRRLALKTMQEFTDSLIAGDYSA